MIGDELFWEMEELVLVDHILGSRNDGINNRLLSLEWGFMGSQHVGIPIRG